MTNTDYLSSMTLVQWKLFNEDERLTMFKASEAKVGNFTASISQFQLTNQNDKIQLQKLSVQLQKSKDDVEKLQFEIEVEEENKADQAREDQNQQKEMKEGQDAINRARKEEAKQAQ